MSRELIRVDSPDAVVSIAQANGERYSRSPWAATVTLGNGVTYFWSAA
jgi:hypothetical protein